MEAIDRLSFPFHAEKNQLYRLHDRSRLQHESTAVRLLFPHIMCYVTVGAGDPVVRLLLLLDRASVLERLELARPS